MSASTSHETLVRILQLIQLIPRSPAQVTVKDLTDELQHIGFKVTSRTVQRDLNDISSVLPLEKNDKSKPYGWKWARDAKTHISLMSLQEALTLHLVNQHLLQMLPPNMLQTLQPLFKQAEQTIENLGDKNQVAHWLESAVVELPSQNFIAASINEVVQQAIYQALFEQKPIKVRYKPQYQQECKDYILHPIGIMQRGVVTYLGAMIGDYEDIRLFALHRFAEADIVHLDSARKASISWQAYLKQGSAGFGGDIVKEIEFSAIINSALASVLAETPLALNQALTERSDGRFDITATIQDSWQFRWWVLSQGSCIKVGSPSELAAYIKEEIELSYQNYQ